MNFKEPIRVYLSKHSEHIESPLEAILEQLRLFNTVDSSISIPLLRELDVRCLKEENIPTEPSIFDFQLPQHILREFVQLDPSQAQHFQYVQSAMQKLILELVNIQRKGFTEQPYLFEANNVILGLVAAVGSHTNHLEFVRPTVTEIAPEIISWLNKGNKINSEHALTMIPLKFMLENSLGTFYKRSAGALYLRMRDAIHLPNFNSSCSHRSYTHYGFE